jgi:hypothetical protein
MFWVAVVLAGFAYLAWRGAQADSSTSWAVAVFSTAALISGLIWFAQSRAGV